MTTHHEEHLLDRAAMLAMRALLAVQPKLQFGPEARPDFDSLTSLVLGAFEVMGIGR